MKKLLSAVLFLSFISLGSFASALPNRHPYDYLKGELGFTQFYGSHNSGRRMKIAILDRTQRGSDLSQLIFSFMTDDSRSPQWEPSFHFYEVRDHQSLRVAIQEILKSKIDLVLLPQLWNNNGYFDHNAVADDLNRLTRQGIILVNALPGCHSYNSIYHANALTVASAQIPACAGYNPDVVINIPAYAADNSVAAAIATAGFALLKSNEPRMTRIDLLHAVTDLSQGLSLHQLGFGYTGPGCFFDIYLNPMPYSIGEAVMRGGVPVQTTAGIRVMMPFDPLQICQGLQRQFPNDMIVAMPNGGYGIFPRFGYIPPGAIELFQRPLEAGLCRDNGRRQNYFRIKPCDFDDDDEEVPPPTPQSVR
ncbi:hypothetical protein [Bdellovibrio reynosensis]|uniref:TIGR03790 family protein n=1 Tax=Bdellovibrio reynosensis TaxID=2835041 RepID=A0ABY4C5J6_9BACT|nr:hypothetical protein [Bdellovibrio reynosensis]UOF00009.1 hypothetical protein MNR06_09880 [Bdellovibrio reynosensis]